MIQSPYEDRQSSSVGGSSSGNSDLSGSSNVNDDVGGATNIITELGGSSNQNQSHTGAQYQLEHQWSEIDSLLDRDWPM